MPVYLINTNHENYQAHTRRWKQSATSEAALYEPDEQTRDIWEFSEAVNHSGWIPPSSSMGPYNALEYAYPDLHAFPGLCYWLWSHGLQIFKNILAEQSKRMLGNGVGETCTVKGTKAAKRHLLRLCKAGSRGIGRSAGAARTGQRVERKNTLCLRPLPLALQLHQRKRRARFWFRKKRTG